MPCIHDVSMLVRCTLCEIEKSDPVACWRAFPVEVRERVLYEFEIGARLEWNTVTFGVMNAARSAAIQILLRAGDGKEQG